MCPSAMALAYHQQTEDLIAAKLSFEERFGMPVYAELTVLVGCIVGGVKRWW